MSQRAPPPWAALIAQPMLPLGEETALLIRLTRRSLSSAQIPLEAVESIEETDALPDSVAARHGHLTKDAGLLQPDGSSSDVRVQGKRLGGDLRGHTRVVGKAATSGATAKGAHAWLSKLIYVSLDTSPTIQTCESARTADSVGACK